MIFDFMLAGASFAYLVASGVALRLSRLTPTRCQERHMPHWPKGTSQRLPGTADCGWCVWRMIGAFLPPIWLVLAGVLVGDRLGKRILGRRDKTALADRIAQLEKETLT